MAVLFPVLLISLTDWFPDTSAIKNPPCNAGDTRLIPVSGRFPAGGNGNPLQYSCLENSWTEEPGGLQFIGLQKDWM